MLFRSGGERRRLQLTRLLMTEPNVLMLDEPTNDFDVETLAALEDLLDSFAGTLLVVSHDRYFLERTCDNFVGLLGDGAIRDLPRGIHEYLELRQVTAPAAKASQQSPVARPQGLSAAEERELKKDLTRIERQLAKVNQQRTGILEQMADNATNFEKVAQIDVTLRGLDEEISVLEESWLDLSTRLDGSE